MPVRLSSYPFAALPPHGLFPRPAAAPLTTAGMVKQGLSPTEAAARFYVLDSGGLITAQASRAD